MILVCIHPFGVFLPGDEVEVPKGAQFDTAYFMVKPDAVPEAKAKESK